MNHDVHWTEGAPNLRADAERNRAQILAAARDVFVEQGANAPLDEVARRAGVGAACNGGAASVDGTAKAEGRAHYPQDLPPPEGCLHAATVRAGRSRTTDAGSERRDPGAHGADRSHGR